MSANSVPGTRAFEGPGSRRLLLPALPEIYGDPVRLRQVVGNLVNNAVKFTESGGVMIELTLDTRDQQRVLIAVRDTGIGVAADRLDTLFEAFTQADTSTTRQYGGTGLGLAICKRLVTAMSGEWRLDRSVEGTGSIRCQSSDGHLRNGGNVAIPQWSVPR